MPRLDDNGTTVSLDLHGARVDDALDLVHSAAELAAEHGRSTLRVIHGASTSDPLARNRTIKHALHDLLDRGGLPEARGDVRFDGETLISLPLGGAASSVRLRLSDLR